jgi:predicted MPP superfamily phosphohydrolase
MKRRTLAGLVFLVVILSVGVGGHAYLANRLALEPGWPEPLRSALVATFGIGLAAVLTQIFVRRRLGIVSSALSWVAYVWLGFTFLLLTTTLATDAALWILGAASAAPQEVLLLARARALLVAGVASAASVVALRQGLAAPGVRRIEIPLARWPQALDGFRIVQISDVHIGPLLDRRFAAEVAARVNALAPDLVAVTGDLVDGSVARIGEEVEPLAAIRARHGVFFITGNHDFYSGADAWADRVRELGWRVLRNERVAIGDGDAHFDLAGVDDHHGALLGPGQGEDLARALDCRETARPVVLLAHDGTAARRAARRRSPLSGLPRRVWPFRSGARAVLVKLFAGAGARLREPSARAFGARRCGSAPSRSPGHAARGGTARAWARAGSVGRWFTGPCP